MSGVVLECRKDGVRVWRVPLNGKTYRAHHRVRTGAWWVVGARGQVLVAFGDIELAVLRRAEAADRQLEEAEASS